MRSTRFEARGLGGFLWLGDLDVPQPYSITVLCEIQGPKPYKFTRFGGLDVHKPYINLYGLVTSPFLNPTICIYGQVRDSAASFPNLTTRGAGVVGPSSNFTGTRPLLEGTLGWSLASGRFPEGSIFTRFLDQAKPRSSLDPRGSSYSASSTKNKPRRKLARGGRGLCNRGGVLCWGFVLVLVVKVDEERIVTTWPYEWF
jgi:hypothetical protein